jgi:hypothetical protein
MKQALDHDQGLVCRAGSRRASTRYSRAWCSSIRRRPSRPEVSRALFVAPWVVPWYVEAGVLGYRRRALVRGSGHLGGPVCRGHPDLPETLVKGRPFEAPNCQAPRSDRVIPGRSGGLAGSRDGAKHDGVAQRVGGSSDRPTPPCRRDRPNGRSRRGVDRGDMSRRPEGVSEHRL